MKINRRYAYQALDRVTHADGTRYYVSPDGERLPSVTTILSATADHTALNEWRARVGEEAAERARTEATGLGSLMHEHLECYAQGLERPQGNNLVRQQARKMADVIIQRGLCHVDEVWGIEVPLYFPGLYAGTTDLVGLYQGQPAIIDFKTAKRMRTSAQVEDYRAQLVAYALASDEVYGSDIQMGVIMMCSRDLQFQAFVVEGDEFKRCRDSFLDRLERHLSGASVHA